MNRQLFVTTDNALDAGTVAETDPTLVGDGGFAVFDSEDGSGGTENLTGVDAPDRLTLVRGGKVPQIEHIEKDKIRKVITQAFRAEVQQESAVGFSGSGVQSLPVTPGAAEITVTRLEKGYEPFPRISVTQPVKEGDLPYSIAAGLVEQFQKNAVTNPADGNTRSFVIADVLSDVDTTQTQDGVPANVTATVVKGSRKITFSTAPATVVAGETIRIGHATDKSYPVYILTALNGTEGTLDRVYQEDSAAGVALGDGAAPAADDKVGVHLKAIPSDGGRPAISFATAADGTLEDAAITSLQSPVTANGSAAQIKNLEEFSWGSRGYYYTNYFPQTPESHVVDGVNYDLLTIVYENDNDDGVLSQNKYREIHIAYPEGNINLATLSAFFTS